MKKFLLSILVASTLFACQKEGSIELNGGVPGSDTTNTSGSLLDRTVIKVGNDSIAALYTYDNNRRLTTLKSITAIGGSFESSEHKVTRNAAGIIQQVTVTYNDGTGPQSATYKVNYNTSLSRYASTVGTASISGQTFKDSTVYTYDAFGKVIQAEEFYGDLTSGASIGVSKTEYLYDPSANVIKERVFAINGATNTYELAYEQNFEYDTKVNPLMLSVEAFLFEDPTLYSTHNVTKRVITDPTNPTQSEVITITYVYNAQNKPASGMISSAGTGQLPLNFIYK